MWEVIKKHQKKSKEDNLQGDDSGKATYTVNGITKKLWIKKHNTYDERQRYTKLLKIAEEFKSKKGDLSMRTLGGKLEVIDTQRK
eukprot:8982251-Pyramimonas_sp.AAC.1